MNRFRTSTKIAQSNHRPLVSIILCTYNRAHLVTRAIASVRTQSCGNWELIIIDDGSADDTGQILMPVVKSDPRITYVYHANQGLARSRNIGIALASGEYSTFLDSDDEYREHHLSIRVRAMEKKPSPALIYGGIEYVGPVERQYTTNKPQVNTMNRSICSTSVRHRLRISNSLPLCIVMPQLVLCAFIFVQVFAWFAPEPLSHVPAKEWLHGRVEVPVWGIDR